MATKIFTVSSNKFIQDETTGEYTATFLADTLGFNGSRDYSVRKFLKNVSGTYKNVLLSYEINLSGDLLIHSDSAFGGKLVIETDS